MAFGTEIIESTKFTSFSTGIDEVISDHASKVAIAGFNGSTGAKIFYHHM